MNDREKGFMLRFDAATVEEKEGRWVITGGKGSGFGVVEVVQLNHGCVLVYGDYDPCVVQRHGGNAIYCARGSGVCGYFMSKASRGMGEKAVREWSADAAVDYIRRNYINSSEEEAASFQEALDQGFETQDEMIEVLNDCGISDAWEYGHLGERPSQRVYVAWAAFRRVIRHIEEKEAAQ